MRHPHHDQLISNGWSYFGKQGDYRPFGYYFKRMEGIPNCHCNNKPPQVVAEPYNHHYQYPQAPDQWSIELDLAGKCSDGSWVHIKATPHQLPPSEWGKHIEQLKAAWTAAEGIK